MRGFFHDLRHAVRNLRKSPGFTAVSVLTMALGIGATTAIFSVAHLVLWRTLPVADPEALVVPRWSASEFPSSVMDNLEGGWDQSGKNYTSESVSYAYFQSLRARARTLAAVAAAASNEEGLNVRIGAESADATGQFVSGNFFGVLGVAASEGRLLSDADDSGGAPLVAVASASLWRRLSESGASGGARSIVVNGMAVTVVGAAPRGFYGIDPSVEPDLWMPLHAGPAVLHAGADGAALFHDSRSWWLTAVGRLRPGTRPAAALAEARALFEAGLAPTSVRSRSDSVRPVLTLVPIARGLDSLRREHTAPLTLLLALVGALLAVTSANVAALLLARGVSRRREIAVRASLGASRIRLIRSLLAESVVIAGAAAAAGSLLASWLTESLLSFWGPAAAPPPSTLDARLLGLSVAVGFASALLSGILPALRSSRADLSSALKASPRAGGGRGTTLGRGLVTIQVAASVVMLVVAGLFVRTLDNLWRAPAGFDTGSLLLLRVRPGANGYEGERRLRFYDEFRRRLAAIPGVASATVSQYPMIGGGVSTSSVRPAGAPADRDRECHRNLVGPEFFATLRIPIPAGRPLDARDGASSPRTAVVNARFAREMFGKIDPIGRSIDFGDPSRARRYEIVGVAGDTLFQDLRGDKPPTVFLSYAQVSEAPGSMTFELRARGDAAALAPAAREALRELDPDLPILALETQRAAVARVLRLERLLASLTSGFGLTGLLLASLGLYGSLALAVAGRTREIGVRMALGAGKYQVVGMVVANGLRPALVGTAAGIAGALAGTRLLRAQLFGLPPDDPVSLAVAVAVLLCAAALACALPARRAARLDPVQALRTE